MKQATMCIKTFSRPFWLAFSIVLLGIELLPAQDLHVYYDLFTDSISYKKDGKPVAKAKIRKGDFLVLHFTEFNPYLYTVETDINQSNSDDWSGGASSGAIGENSGMSGMMSMIGSTTDQGAGPMSFMNIPLLSMGENSLKLSDLFGGSRGTEAMLLQQAQGQLKALAQIQAQMTEIYEEIESMERSERAAQLASRHIDKMLYNPRMKPSLIRRVAKEYSDMIFPEKSAEDLQLTDAFQWQKRPAVKRRLLSDLEAKQQEFDTQLLQMTPIAQQLNALDVGSPALESFAGDLLSVTQKSGSLREQLEAYLRYQSDKATKDLSLEEMLALQLKFRELADQSFSYDVAIAVARHTVIVNARFIPVDSLFSTEPAKKPGTKTKTVRLESFGGLKINTGFGVGFTRLFEPAQEFSARDNAIVADESGLVQPSLSTYIHFYPNSRSGVAFAGTFGVGIPLSTSNISSLNFFLGPSFLFGRGQRIVLSGGLTAGPTQRLSKGFEVGDYFDPNLGDIPTHTNYDLGYFLGISFNLGG